MNRIVFVLLFIGTHLGVLAAKVDTVITRSNLMQKPIKAVVVIPEIQDGKKNLPVVYLLHGYSGNYADWIKNVPELGDLADRYQCIIVCPDGGFSSWYWDSPKDKSYQYESYVTKELIGYIDEHYPTIKDRKGRAITGLSMGGHGALYLAFRHQDLFGAAGSMSGGVDIRPFPANWDMAKRLGDYADEQQSWEQHTVTNMLYLLKPKALSILIDCGTEDFFYTVNKHLHEKMRERNIKHDFISKPGAHNWDYWRNAIPYQLLFMSQYFE